MNELIKHAVIVLPTYNEQGNIKKILEAIVAQQIHIPQVFISVLVVDDLSPDGTGDIVREMALLYPNIFLLNGMKKQGLGKAYLRGFHHAVHKLKADIVFQMDADFSHNPNLIPLFIQKILEGYDFVIGSRYIKGGSVPTTWPALRRANSKFGNILARHIAGIPHVKDCTSGYRAIRVSTLKKMNLKKLHVRGYSFIMNLLHEAIKSGAIVTEIPIHYTERTHGKSKLSIKDITEFIANTITLRFPFIKALSIVIPLVILGVIFIDIPFFLVIAGVLSLNSVLLLFIALLALLMSIQGMVSIYWMLYTWAHPDQLGLTLPNPDEYKPTFSFTALVPARHEENVILHTIHAISSINYPEELKETFIVCKSDDAETIRTAEETIRHLHKDNIRVITFDDLPINKPHSLNVGLKKATKDVVVVFDAEDEPHHNIYNIVNSVFIRENAQIVQSGVQLMNFRSSWYSPLNVLEYFFWFKSTLHYFAKKGIVPLGGNTVFFKREYIEEMNGWDEDCLTEDADIGIRLSVLGAKVSVIYDEKHVTQEETPPNLRSFIKQRTRWNQGFIQIFLKGEWLRLPTFFQRLLAAYILLLPQLQACLFLLIPLSLVMILNMRLPVWVALLTTLPLYLLILQQITYNIGLYMFTKEYGLAYRFWYPVSLLITFIPFNMVLGYSALRAISRVVRKKQNWEKTHHTNAHRSEVVKQFNIQKLSMV